MWFSENVGNKNIIKLEFNRVIQSKMGRPDQISCMQHDNMNKIKQNQKETKSVNLYNMKIQALSFHLMKSK